MQREYGRLNLNGTMMSKRDIRHLIEKGIVRGWDDPRLYTLKAIRRRVVPPGALLDLIYELGASTAMAFTDVKRFEQSIRRYLEATVPRLMMVLDPIPVVIEDAEEHDLEVPFSPKDPEMGSRKIRLTKRVFIERSDFRETPSPGYFRLAPGEVVGLMRVPYPIRAVSFEKDESTGVIKEIRAIYDKNGPQNPKAYIHWVPEGSLKAEVRLHGALFESDQPGSAPGGFMSDLAPESETIWPEAMIEHAIHEVRSRAPWPKTAAEQTDNIGSECTRFQALRVAYFVSEMHLFPLCGY
jgi:glutaminyl-tRNA synthetase